MSSLPPPHPPNPVFAAAEVPKHDPKEELAEAGGEGGLDRFLEEAWEEVIETPPSAPPPLPLLCARVGCDNLGSLGKRCGKCLVACYCCVECQREHWPAHKKQCKENRKFELSEQTEEYLFALHVKCGFYFDRLFAGNEEGFERYSALFEQLGDLGFERGKGINSITVGVLMILRSYKDRRKLEALAKLAGREEGFDDRALHLEAMRSVLPLLEEAHAAGDGVTEEEVLDGVMALGIAYTWVDEWNECRACFRRAKEGFVRLLGEDSAKAVHAAYSVASRLPSDDERIAEYRRLWEMAKVSLPEETVTYDIASQLGYEMRKKGKYEEAKVFYLAALEGRRRVLGEEHKDTLASMNNMGVLLHKMEDYEGSLDYFQQAFRVQETVLGKTHPDALTTIMNMANTYMVGLKDFVKAEEMFRQALDGYEKSLGKEHEHTKLCARNLAKLLVGGLRDKEKMRELIKGHPHLLHDPLNGVAFREFIR